MKKLKRIFNVLMSVAGVTYKEWAAYRSHMLLSLIIGPLYFVVQYFIWNAVYQAGGSINGFNLRQIIAYYGTVILLHYLIMDFADWNLQMLIRTGKFLTFILRPMHHWFFAFAQKVGHRTLGFIFEFLPVYLLLAFVFKLPLVPVQPVYFIVSVFFSFTIMFFINYCIGITGFWLTRTSGISLMLSVLRDFMAGVFIPLSFFPGIIQKFFFIMPFQFITYVPLQVFSGTYSLAGISLQPAAIVAIQGIVVIAVFLFTRWLYFMGIRQFTGAGT